jgi:transcriptional regulator with GAF, ATPase, and Fis domain
MTTPSMDDLAARAQASEQMADRLRILAEAAHEFSATTQDLEGLLSTVARRVAAVVQDMCVVRLLSEDGRTLIPVAIHARDEDAERLARAGLSEPLQLDMHPISRQVHESGEPFFVARLDLEELRARATPPASVEYMKDAGIHSVLMVPLRLQGRSIGHLLLQRYRPEKPALRRARQDPRVRPGGPCRPRDRQLTLLRCRAQRARRRREGDSALRSPQ